MYIPMAIKQWIFHQAKFRVDKNIREDDKKKTKALCWYGVIMINIKVRREVSQQKIVLFYGFPSMSRSFIFPIIKIGRRFLLKVLEKIEGEKINIDK